MINKLDLREHQTDVVELITLLVVIKVYNRLFLENVQN